MSDFRARQRVAIHDGTDEFGVLSSKPLFVSIQDGGNVISIDDAGGSITVDGSVSITGSVTVTATDLDIRDLTHVSDSVKVGDGTDFLAIAADGSIAVTDNGASLTVDDGGGSITVDGSVSITGSVTVTATDLDIRNLSHSQDSVKIGDGTDFLAVNADGSINVVVAATSGTKVHDYDTSAAVAKDASDNHDYTVTATKTLKLRQIIVAASGAMKITLQVGPLASLVTKGVWFTSGAKPTEVITFDVPIDVPDTLTGTVRVIRRNDDHAAMDVYSTIIGEEV